MDPIVVRCGFSLGSVAWREIPAVICDDNVWLGLRDEIIDFAANKRAMKQIDKKLGKKIFTPWIYARKCAKLDLRAKLVGGGAAWT